MFVKSTLATILAVILSCAAYVTLRPKTKRRADRRRFKQSVNQSWNSTKRYASQLFPQGSKKVERAAA